MNQAASNTVSLAIPSKPDYIVLARLALSAICRLTPLGPDDVADLKLAVSEIATERLADAGDGELRIGVELQEDRLVVELEPAGLAAEEESLSRAIVDATVDEAEYGETSVRLVKRLPEPVPLPDEK